MTEVEYTHLRVHGEAARASTIGDMNVKTYLHCCSCEGPLGNTQYLVWLNLLATWENPVYTVYSLKSELGLTVSAFSMYRAYAIICHTCYFLGKSIKYAVEHNKDYENIIYHDVEKLEFSPQIHAKDLKMKVNVLFAYYQSQDYEGNVLRVVK